MHRLRHNARRAWQTLSCFDDGTVLLGRTLRRRAHPELTYSVKGGPVIHCPNVPGARVPVYELFADDAYRLDALLAGLPEDLRVLDIGGHIGCFSVAVAAARPEATIHAFEASPGTTVWLARNVAANGLGERVHVHGQAVSDHRGTLAFADNAGGSSQNQVVNSESAGAVTVPCITLADAFQAQGAPPHLVKIDTEGAEYDMLLSASPDLWRDVQAVVIEYHDVAGHEWAELETYFAGVGIFPTHHEPMGPRQGTVWLHRAEERR